MNSLDRDPERRLAEVNAMQSLSKARLVRLPNGQYAWVEQLTSIGGQPYTIAITYPERFPHEPPLAFVLKPDVSGAPHRFQDGSLCLFDHNANATSVKTTAIVVRNRAVVWFALYEVWLQTRQWCPLLSRGTRLWSRPLRPGVSA